MGRCVKTYVRPGVKFDAVYRTIVRHSGIRCF